ncbi:aminotransferase class IV family protein [Sulfurimonas sp. HSL3-2]|uniref:aminotransferase class IV family protein n=1 Tax=Hydrocurvibacter mobilis TaxID=3131936 RepID=UPI0031F8DCA6
MNNNLLETIKAIDGEIQHLSYHQSRYENSLRTLNKTIKYDLKEFITPPKEGVYRCRVIYNENDINVTYHPYAFNEINSLKLLTDDTIDYPLKYENRTELDRLFDLRGECDDILIVKNSLLTDTSKANIALFDGSKWYTPKNPLLQGTSRARHLDQGRIFERTLHIDDLSSFSEVAVLNAMVDFYIVKNGIIS